MTESSASPRARSRNESGASATGWNEAPSFGVQMKLPRSSSLCSGKSDRLWQPRVSRRSTAHSSVARAAIIDP